ncbi:Hydroperoxide isomerase ALOXE3 [Dissostichus eleginoides]|uniref:Hydroperoxide isomerase ALOXE3 n=1 Tax=Dissostichus eleginoides TaxID=100907 RepID=A0AAD9CE15_DISEL|nr:Hydroperoxide isomerase ALOXE3 [Dissostichus eleginoides]
MAEYKLEITTGDLQYAGTSDYIYVTLFGTEGQSERTLMDNYGFDFQTGAPGSYTVKTSSSLGKLLLVKVEKDQYLCLPENEWYFSKMVVTTPEGDVILYPCYRWIGRGEMVELRGGRAMKAVEEDHPLLIEHRKKELMLKKSLFQWKSMAEGLPHIHSFNDVSEIPAEMRFSDSRTADFNYSRKKIGIELKVKGLQGSTAQWESIEDIKKIFWFKKTTMSEYVAGHWMEDDFYGYQFLNGVNPGVIKRCSELPTNFPVTEEMVKPFLEEGSSLQKEMEKGNMFLYDQKKMDGIPPAAYNGEPLHVTAGLCLLNVNPENKLMPIAIQLNQQPSEKNPIFLPSDPETDWLLAKIFIKNADCMDHESVHHLMRTHFLAEVFAVAALRSFPVIHPIYKVPSVTLMMFCLLSAESSVLLGHLYFFPLSVQLLFPHFRHTLDLNTNGRLSLLGPDGVLSDSSLGIDGLMELMRRDLSEMTYSSLCLPENIAARGLESIPNFYYRDDGLKLWNIIQSFVKAVVEHYYPSDSEVHRDTELQDWISEVFTHGFLGNKASGFPAAFHTVEEVVKFTTMVIFTTTVQHTAVNSGQYDYSSWAPNGSLLLRKPPPTTKGQSSMKTVLETLPNVGETVRLAAFTWLLSDKYADYIPLGTYPEERFDEPEPKKMIKEFQAELSCLSEAITTRNSHLELPYTYLDPAEIENSICT